MLKREIGQSLFHVLDDPGVDLSAITITHVIAGQNLRNARVLVSIRDHQSERRRILGILRKNRGKMQEIINRNLTLKYTPCLSFELDTSVEKGDHILQVLSQIEQEQKGTSGQEDQVET